VTLLNSSFYQDVQFTFTPGSVLSFQFVSTSNVDAVAPDAFTVAILDHTLSEIPTNNPNGLNSFLEVDLPSAGSGTQVTASSDTSGIGVTTMVTVVPPAMSVVTRTQTSRTSRRSSIKRSARHPR
jgi:hypothetical protein